MRYAAGAPCTVYVTEWQRRDSIQSIRFVTLTHSICITLILEFPSAYSSQFEIPLIVSGLKSHPASLSMSYGKRGCIIRPFLMLSLRRQNEGERIRRSARRRLRWRRSAAPRASVSLASLTRNYTHRHDSQCTFVAARPITPPGISLTTWRVIIGECCHVEY